MLLIAFFFFVIIYRQKELMELNEIKYDVSTITAVDFSCELEISERDYMDFLNNEYKPKAKHLTSPGLYLKQYLKKKIDEMLSNYFRLTERLGKDKLKELSEVQRMSSQFKNLQKRIQETFQPFIEDQYRVRVAEVAFAYENKKIIDLLKLRGKKIRQMRYDLVDDLDKEIISLIKDEKEYYRLTRPVCAFITFFKERGKDQAMKFSKLNKLRDSQDHHRALDYFVQHTIFNQIPYFKDAPDPTNIIWENRHINYWTFISKLGLSFLFLGIILISQFYLIYSMKKMTLQNMMKYQTVDCNSIYDVYGSSESDKIKYAYTEYQNEIDSNGKVPLNGNLQCFCTDMFKAGNSKD